LFDQPGHVEALHERPEAFLPSTIHPQPSTFSWSSGQAVTDFSKMTPLSTITIQIDDRERCNDVLDALRQADHVELRIERLGVGDYCLDSQTLVERKTLPDLMLSIVDGRLFRQAVRLAKSGFDPLFILEGTARDIQTARVSREAVQGAMIAVSVILGIPVLRSQSPQETAWLLVRSACQLRRAVDGNTLRPGYRPHRRRKRQLFILQGLPGIGPERAERLLDRFGSVQNVVNAEHEELCSVKGIGKGVAGRIQDILHEPHALYMNQELSSGLPEESS
jgi:ERCC4-type nuclease